MDLIYTDHMGEDIGVIKNYNLDNESSILVDDCTYVLEMTVDNDVFVNAGYIYVDGTEYGGIIDYQTVDTARNIMKLSGRTWRGLIGSKIIEPPLGSSHFIVNNELNRAIAEVINRIGLQGIYSVSAEDTGVNINYQFDRYIDAYTGLINMLKSANYKLMLEWYQGTIKLHAEPITEYTQQEAITSDLFDFEVTFARHSVNHMIGLGQGELEDRQVIHKYIQEDGTIGDTQYYFGTDEYTAIYDKANAKDFEDLELGTIQALEDMAQQDQIKINSYNLNCDIGDMFTAEDILTGIEVKQFVSNKIVIIKDNTVNISYKVGAL